MRVYGHSTASRIATVGHDVVVAAMAIPGETRVNNVWLKVDGTCRNDIALNAAMGYGCSAYIIGVPDPDGNPTPETLWDNLVPKDRDLSTGGLDMDSVAQDTASEVEWGESSMSDLADMSLTPERLFRQADLVTYARRPAGFHWVTAGGSTWSPTWNVRRHIKKNYWVRVPSMLLVGVSNPNFDQDANFFQPSSAADWMQMKYLQRTLEKAFDQIAGLTEATAETPYIEAATLIEAWLSQFDEAAPSDFSESNWDVHAQMTVDMSVRGDVGKFAVSTGE